MDISKIEDILKMLRGRIHYEDLTNGIKLHENNIMKCHITISERIEQIFKIKNAIGSKIFDIKKIKKV